MSPHQAQLIRVLEMQAKILEKMNANMEKIADYIETRTESEMADK